jgi:hypothetical protein
METTSDAKISDATTDDVKTLGKSSAALVANIIYAIGVVVFLVLVGFVAFGAGIVPHPDAMIAWSASEIATIALAVGTIPMFFACMAVYHFNHLKQSVHRKRNLFLVFLPTFLCGIPLLYFIVIVAIILIEVVAHGM